MPPAWQTDADSEEDDLDDDDQGYQSNKDCLLICIESSARMVSQDGKGGDSTLLLILRCVLDIMKRKVIVSGGDKVGVIVFNTADTKMPEGEVNNDNIMFIRDLESITADGIKKMSTLIKSAEKNPQDFAKKYQPQDKTSVNKLTAMLSLIKMVIKSRAGASGGRTFLFTDNDDPYPPGEFGNARQISSAHTLAKDSREMKYDLTPFFITRPDAESDFDRAKFYDDFFAVGFEQNLDDSSTFAESPQMFKDILNQFRIRNSPRRAFCSIPFVISKGLEIGIQCFNFVTEVKKPSTTTVDRSGRDIREVASRTTYTDQDSSRPLDVKKDAKPYFRFGTEASHEKIVFQPTEIYKAKSVGLKPSLRLLGFTTLNKFPPESQVKHSHFIYPTEEPLASLKKSFTGSKRVFTSLLQTMLQKEVVGFGVFLPRTNSTPQHVLIVPQEEVLDHNGRQSDPPGFHLLQLAFADDMRDLNLTKSTTIAIPGDASAHTAAVEAFTNLTSRLKQTYAADKVPNPTLNYFYNMLEAISLREPPPIAHDNTLPLYNAIRERGGKDIAAFNQAIESHPSYSAPVFIPSAKEKATGKRKRADSDSDDEEEVLSDENLAALLKEDRKSKLLTIARLKAYLKKAGKPVSGKKADLLERAEEHLKAQMEE